MVLLVLMCCMLCSWHHGLRRVYYSTCTDGNHCTDPSWRHLYFQHMTACPDVMLQKVVKLTAVHLPVGLMECLEQPEERCLCPGCGSH